MTIQELQTFINTQPDIRQLINAIVDYLQANPSGGGGSSLPDQTGLAPDNYYLQVTGSGGSPSWSTISLGFDDVLANDTDANGAVIQNLGGINFKDNTNSIRMFSPNGNPWIVRIANDGTLSVVDDS